LAESADKKLFFEKGVYENAVLCVKPDWILAGPALAGRQDSLLIHNMRGDIKDGLFHSVTVHGFRVQGSGLGKKMKLDRLNPRKKCGFCHIIAKCHVPDLWGGGSGRFSRVKRLQDGVW
jgi:hypothetical protein